MTKHIIIDTDPGIDDALAIMLAAASPEVRILGMTAVAGNTGLEYTASNLAKIADLLGLDVPLGRGAVRPLWRRDTVPDAGVHGSDGLGGYQLPASERVLEPAIPLLARLVEESDQPVTIVAIGPLTNIALFLNEYPETARKVERIVIMGGGARDVLGNATPTAEFNIYYDPDAAAAMFDFGVPITMIGLDVTHKALVGSAHLAGLFASGGPIAAMVEGILGHYGEHAYSGNETDDAVAQHDSLAIAAAFLPDIVTTEHRYVDVENVGRLTSGMTVVDFAGRSGRKPNCDVALDVDADRFAGLLADRLTQLDETLKERA